MGRINGKNNMRTPEEKEKIVLEKLNGATNASLKNKYKISGDSIWEWTTKYLKYGIEGLKSKTGKCATKGNVGRPKKVSNREDELERENAKLKIEIERLKKGYYVKGVGQRKEYVSINNKNIKSSEN